jgi:aspartyl-tRNA(Asn)/glutamyl-tRNA(Gln) amidotransferase subunit C
VGSVFGEKVPERPRRASVAISKETVRHVAMLSRLAMSDAELDRFTEQLNAILDYIGKLNQLDTSAVEPMSHALALKNVFRSDEVRSPLAAEKALGNAPEKGEGFFRVPRIIE